MVLMFLLNHKLPDPGNRLFELIRFRGEAEPQPSFAVCGEGITGRQDHACLDHEVLAERDAVL